tara:strand:+ start:1385 stop:2044 length:660 start_codon:yes stop_codon:yes gene_type:complete
VVDEIAMFIRTVAESLDGHERMECEYEWIEKDDLWIKNEMWTARALRKIHLETCRVKGLDVLHCVFFPDYNYNIPIFGCDIIASKYRNISIVDVSPTRGSDWVYPKIQAVSQNYRFKEPQLLPEWGDIFSHYMKFQRIRDDVEQIMYFKVLQEYLTIYRDAVGKAEKMDYIDAMIAMDDQIHYSTQQRKNEKTIATLGAWFDKDWALSYIDNILFDLPK